MRGSLGALRRALRPVGRRFVSPRPCRIRDYRAHLVGRPRGRALLSYVPEPVRDELAGAVTTSFSNQGIAVALPRALNELGLAVDVVSYDDVSFRTSRRYDVLVQHGGVNFELLERRLRPSAKVVYFATGCHWREWNAAGEERAAAFAQRHGVVFPHDRRIEFPEESALRRADGILALGNGGMLESYGAYEVVRRVDIGVFPDPHLVERDLTRARNGFLFFAGTGNLHKGLDLTLEAFSGLPYELHVATWVEPAFAAVYADLIRGSPNIHVHGPVQPRSPRFHELAGRCAFAVAPTCAEGQPGAVVECVNVGLLPLVTRTAFLDVDGFGWIVEPTIEAIRASAAAVAALPAPELEERSREARRIARERHSPELFLAAVRRHLADILGTE